MRLNTGGVNMRIEGFFSNIKTARNAVDKLRSAGFESAFVDINDHYNEDRNIQTNLPGTENSLSLSGLVLESGEAAVDSSKAPLAAANPMVSGIGQLDEVADVNCKVIIETDAHDAERARQIIRDVGGELVNPNVEAPKFTDNDNVFSEAILSRVRKDV
jgi:hypothetical protein